MASTARTPEPSRRDPLRLVARKTRSRRAQFLRWFALVFAALLGVRMLLPIGLRAYVNRVLDGMPGYEGRIGKLDLNLWRGAYEIEELALLRSGGAHPEPFLEVQRLDLSLTWAGLAHGKLVGEAVLHHPVVSFVAGETQAESQTGEGPSWASRLDALFPFRIERFVLRDGEVRFKSEKTDPPVDLYVDDLYLEAHNLTNVRGKGAGGLLPAEVEAAGRPFGTGELEARLRFDPLAERPRFELDAAVRAVRLADLNDFLQAYGKVDAERGTFEMYTEFAASDGEVEGYVKTLFEDVQLLSLDEIDGPGDAMEAFWEGLVELGAQLFKNQPRDRLAAYIPLRGRTDDVNADLITTVGSLLRNAFVVALRPAIEESIEIEDLEVVAGGDERDPKPAEEPR
jgi:hypothetical protein